MPPLRHLVLFKFLASSTAEQQKAVSTALSELPSIIPNILYYRVFRLAHNLFPGHSTHSGGYSMLIDSIFADAAALSVYAPHPAHQGVIAKYIAPIREDNLVVDYVLSERFNIDAWKQLQRAPHIRHLLLVKAKADVPEAEMRSGVATMEGLQVSVPGVLSTVSGQQRLSDMYAGYADRSQGVVDVVEIVLQDAQALQTYTSHPEHVAVQKEFGPKLERIITFDYEAGNPETGGI